MVRILFEKSLTTQIILSTIKYSLFCFRLEIEISGQNWGGFFSKWNFTVLNEAWLLLAWYMTILFGTVRILDKYTLFQLSRAIKNLAFFLMANVRYFWQEHSSWMSSYVALMPSDPSACPLVLATFSSNSLSKTCDPPPKLKQGSMCMTRAQSRSECCEMVTPAAPPIFQVSSAEPSLYLFKRPYDQYGRSIGTFTKALLPSSPL